MPEALPCWYGFLQHLKRSMKEVVSTISKRLQFLVVALLKLDSVALVRERTMPTDRPPLVVEVNANFC
jgi:hypothetical protein